MTARVLIVDDIAANVRLLQAKLEADYYEVLTASMVGQPLLRLLPISRILSCSMS